MIFNSIQWRLQLWYGLILIGVLAGFGFTASQLARSQQFRLVDQELQRRLGPVDESLRTPPQARNRRPGRPGPEGFPEGPPPEEQPFPPGPETSRPARPPGGDELPRLPPRRFTLLPRHAALFDDAGSNSFYYVVWSRTGEELGRSTNAPVSLQKPQAGPGQNLPPHLRGNYREIAHATPLGEISLVGRSVAPELSGLRASVGWLILTGIVILLLGLLGGWWISSRAIRPIKSISRAAVKIAAGDLSQRIDVADTENELGRLAGVLNSTFARLESAFTRQKQFTSDAAHELRTPVSVILTQAQSTLNRERSPVEYRETLEACARAAQRMRRLIESLLELARLDAGSEAMKLTRCDLAQIAHECVDTIKPVAEARSIRIVEQLPPCYCLGDSDRISQVIINLLSNAIQYSPDGTEISAACQNQSGTALLCVKDQGEGIPQAELPHIFERFYRVEKSRQAGRTGLGLAISKTLVEAMGGTIRVSSQVGAGSEFEIRFPRASDSSRRDA
jgi:two-component system, OmpR family, sensor kinase